MITSYLKSAGATRAEIICLLRNFPFGTGARLCGFRHVESMSGIPKFTIENVPTRYLDTTQAYQRDDKLLHQKKLARNSGFKHDACELDCASRVLIDPNLPDPGCYHVLNGKQRLGVADILRKDRVTIHLWLTDSLEREANLFRIFNEHMKMSPSDGLASALIAASPDDPLVKLKSMCTRHNMRLEGDKIPPPGLADARVMACISKTRELITIDEQCVDRVLSLLAALPAWSSVEKAPSYRLIRAIFGLLRHDADNYKRFKNRIKSFNRGGVGLDVAMLEKGVYANTESARARRCTDSMSKLARALALFLNMHVKRSCCLTYPNVP